jgi:hypothetical protein
VTAAEQTRLPDSYGSELIKKTRSVAWIVSKISQNELKTYLERLAGA